MNLATITILALAFVTIFTQTSTPPCDTTICECQNSKCVSCLANEFYYNSTQQTCKLCPPECRTCNEKQQCLTCRDMFFFSNAQCLSCPKFCRTCNSSQCTLCINGYILINSVCQKCRVANVQTCESLMTVKTCLTGYWKNGDSCSPCREFCQFCTSSNNCLRCQAGYRTRVSAGTFCVACDTGCRTCSDTSCTECFWNFRLVNGTCSSIVSNCSLISNCESCEFVNNTVRCVMCTYPYYISSNGTCVQGSSILCKYSSSSEPYQCLNECSALAYASPTILSSSRNINQLICLPRLWIQNTVIEQVSFNALYSTRYEGTFTSYNQRLISCGSEYIYSSMYEGLSNVIEFRRVFQPYYKLVIHAKILPLYKSVLHNAMGFIVNARMSDNASNSFTVSHHLNGTQLFPCQEQYLILSSRIIKDQAVTIELRHQLTSSIYDSASLESTFDKGLIGYRQLLVQVFRCDSRCRICSNVKYCLQCYGNLFLSSNKCVATCDGLFEFYLPNGDYLNFQSKYCVQQCPIGYYSTLHPLKNVTYICLKCPDQCRTCRSPNECLSCVTPYLLFSSNFSCLLSCPNSHYASLSTLQCLPCNAPCRTCANQTQCLSCSIGYFDGNNCVRSCPQGTYSSDSLKQCLNCDPKCSICRNTPTFCTACNQPFKLLGTSCLDSCPANTHYTSNYACLPCKSPCTLCSSQTECITCSRGFLLNKTCQTNCPNGYYRDVGNSRCNLCENNCLTCLSLSICRSCVPGTYLFNTMCLSQCPLRTYTSASNVCIPCIPPCLTCVNDTRCITCSLGFLSQVSPFTCVNQCENGYFGQSSNQTCMKCSSTCKTCSQQQNFCLTCNTGLLLENNACVNSCSSNYFAFNNQKCRPCSYPCRTCVQISSKCLSCQNPFILSGQNKCSLQCLSSQYRSNGTCLPCQQPCASCTDITTCTTCRLNTSNQTYLFNGNCLSYCPTQMYADPLSLRCRVCVFPCKTCLSSRECLSCVSGYLNVAKKTCEVCSSNYYPDETSKTCKLCSSTLSNCQQCQSNTVCRLCDSGYLLMNTTCVSEAQCTNKAGYFVNNQLKRCSECRPPCKECLNSTFCYSCVNGNLFQGRCPFTCSSGFYANQSAKQCLACNYSICKTCVNSPNECTSCFQTNVNYIYFVDNKTCIGQTECPETYYLDDLFGFWRCLKCIPPCSKCTNASHCLSCTTGVLFRGSCSFSCPNRHYANVSTSVSLVTCEQCSIQCLECTQSSSTCISCPVSKLLQDNACVDQCSAQYYLNQYILECLKCQSPCMQCQTATYCKSCDNSSKILYFGQCIDVCPEGTYISGKSCVPCPSSCQICSFSSQTNSPICQKCSQNLFMNSTSYGKCETSCYQTEYPDSQTRKCYKCQVPCLQCHTATRCKTCIDGYLIYKSECLKGDLCMPGTYRDPVNKQCLDQCYAPNFGDSLTRLCSEECTANRLKVPIQNSRVCTQQCPSNYAVDSDFKCLECSDGHCSDILSYKIFAKSIFNRLYVKVRFSKEVMTNLINESNVKVFIMDLSLPKIRRLLTGTNSSTEEYGFTITERSSQSLWLELNTYKTLKKVSVKVHFLSYYLLSPIPSQPSIGTNLQTLNTSILMSRFDHYTVQEQQAGEKFEGFSIFLSLLLVGIIVLSLVGNFLSLFYHLIDYFQILFMLLFLQIDYPPALNYFLYGFRYSHYLFFPQIFRPEQPRQYSNNPGKFGIIVPDADFLSNTGHDLLIIFACLGVVILARLVDFLLTGSVRNNRVSNDPGSGSQIDKHSVSIKHQLEEKSQQQNEPYPSQNMKQQHDSKQALHQIELQMFQGKHGMVAKLTKIFISRLKWNYFNDVFYCLYFYIALFTYSHTYVMNEASFMSNLFAFIGFSFTLALPVFLIYLLNRQRSIIESHGMEHKVYLPFKTFYYFTLPDSSYTLYNVPIRYLKKLLIAILLVFCSQFPQFVLGIIMMLSLLNIILTYLYKPYILTFEVYIQVGIELLFVSVIFCLCLMELEYLDLDTAKKLIISQVVVGITILLTIVLIVWNAVRFTVEVVKDFCGKDYFENYYKEPLEQSSTHQTTQRSSQAKSIHEQSRIHETHEESNVRLHDNIFSKHADLNSDTNSKKSENIQSSMLDIYLKKQNDAPPMLIKCIKNFSDPENNSEDEQEDSDKLNNPHQDNSYNRHQNKYQTTQQVSIDHKGRKAFKESQKDEEASYQNSRIYMPSSKQYSQNLEQSIINQNNYSEPALFDDFGQQSGKPSIKHTPSKLTPHQHKQHSNYQNQNNEFHNSNNPQSKHQLETQKQQKTQERKVQKSLKAGQQSKLQIIIPNITNESVKLPEQPQPIILHPTQSRQISKSQGESDNQEQKPQEVGEIFLLEEDITRNKMKTIMEIEDFDVDEQTSHHSNDPNTQQKTNQQCQFEKKSPENKKREEEPNENESAKPQEVQPVSRQLKIESIAGEDDNQSQNS